MIERNFEMQDTVIGFRGAYLSNDVQVQADNITPDEVEESMRLFNKTLR